MALLAATVSLVGGLPTPDAGAQSSGSENSSLQELQRKRDEVRSQAARKKSEIDALKADDQEVEAALDALERNVRATHSKVEEAERALERANAEEQAALAAQDTAAKELEALKGQLSGQAVVAYTSLGDQGEYAMVNSSDFNDLTQRQALLEASSSNNLDLMERYRTVQEDLGIQRAAAERARKKAEAQQAAVQDRLADLQSAQQEQEDFAGQIDTRLDSALSEADNLSGLDASLAASIQQKQAQIAARLAAQRRAAEAAAAAAAARAAARAAASRSTSSGPANSPAISAPRPATPASRPAITGSGEIVTVGGIQIHRSMADNLAALLAAASAAGIELTGGGYRNPASQIAVRRNNCGSSDYAIYDAPASSCRPPTARPGTSMHERGLAVDFIQGGRTLTRGSSAYGWLKANAASFGFYNLPSEPWHWSSNGQ